MEYFEHIEDYLEGRLPEEDKQLFDDELKRNEELRIALDNHQEVSSALDLLVEEGVRDVIREDKIKEVELIPIRQNKSWFYIGVAASLLLLAVAINILRSFGPATNEDLYAEYFSDFLPPTTRGADYVEDLSVCDKAHYLMSEGEVGEAQLLLENHLKQVEDNCTDKSQWYMMLINLRQDQDEKRDGLLEAITSDAESIYRERAKELKDKLN